MAEFTTDQATKYLRECLTRPRNPMPFLLIEYAHKQQKFTEIETRLQGHFGFHDHAPSLHLIARDAVCNLVLERDKARAEQIENYKGWERRRVAACGRINAGLYGYCDPQAEDDGISLAAIDTEMGQLMNEYHFTDEDVAAIECEVTPDDPRNRTARVTVETAALNVLQPDPAHGFLHRIRVKIEVSAACESCGLTVNAGIDRRNTERQFVAMLINAGWVAAKTGLSCKGCAQDEVARLAQEARAAALKISTCAKCRKETTEALIPVDREDFDARAWDVPGFPIRPGVQVFRRVCGGCCRGSR